MKKIEFIANNDLTYILDSAPEPSRTLVPNWFKKAPIFKNNHISSNSVKDYVKSINTNDSMKATYKQCVPFTDAMTSGYSIVLSTTIFVIQEKNANGNMVPRIFWNTLKEPADYQEPTTIPHFPTPMGCSDSLFRWINDWKIQTPVGYSTLFMHPVARHDLPFITLTGFVDTDKHKNSVLFPFFLKNNFEGEITKGTPIVQLYPIKRENWKSFKKIEENKFGTELIKQQFLKGYKKLYWTKKQYS